MPVDMYLHIAASLSVAAFLFRDQILLRVALLFGNLFYTVFYLLQPAQPLLEAAAWSSAMMSSNLLIIMLLVWERKLGPMTCIERKIYHQLGTPMPGHYRRLMRYARHASTTRPLRIIRSDRHLTQVFYLYEGDARVEFPNRSIAISAPGFYGELSFLLDQPATADVVFKAGSKYLVWDRATLRSLFDRSPALEAAFEQLLSRDMARKMSAQRSAPIRLQPRMRPIHLPAQ